MTVLLDIDALAESALVPSDSRRGHRYLVLDALTRDAICSCPDWLHRRIHDGKPCKHIERVRRAIALVEEAKALLGKT